MGAGHVPELGDAVLDPTSGSAQVGGPRMLTQCEEGLLAAEALVPGPGPAAALLVTSSSRDSSTSGS